MIAPTKSAVRLSLTCAWLLAFLLAGPGCTRHFYRDRADNQVEQVLREKNVVPNGKIENFHVYPDSRARFADPTNPDRPPMPPDDPLSKVMSPTPQKPGHAGVARVEGKGYLALMDAWDEHNRQTRRPVTGDLSEESSIVDLFHRKRALPASEDLAPRPLGPDGLPLPYLLKLDQAVELGIINSREFQNRREDLYLLALPVTFERFGFAAQFFAAEQIVRERTGSELPAGQGDRWRGDGAAGFSKLFSTGALLLFQYANQTVINLSNSRNQSTFVSTSALNLDIVQPLLKGGGKAVTLEPLTQAERNLLYEVRDYARFRKVFFQYVSGGSDLNVNLLSPGGGVGGSLIPGTTILSSGNPVRPILLPSASTRLTLSTGILAPSSGYVPTLLRQAALDIEKQNYQRLTSVFSLFKAYEGGGRVSSLQVGQVELQILQSKSNIATLGQLYRDSLDNLKFQLGVPLDVPMELDPEIVDPVFRQFNRYESTISQFNNILKEVENLDTPDDAPQIRAKLAKLLTDAPFVRATKAFRVQFPERWKTWQRDVLDDKALATKLTALRTERNRLLDEKLNQEIADTKVEAKLVERLKILDRDVPTGEFEAALRRLESMPWKLKANARDKIEEFNATFREVRNGFSEVLSDASNERLDLLRPQWPALAGVTIGDVDLVNGDLDQGYSIVSQTALENRFDLLNARAQVVDTWRQVAVRANALLGAFNVGYHLDSSTPPDEARPLAFAGSRTRHQLFLNFELPLVRVAERNAYRATLIAYQRARRALMATEDTVVSQVRTDLRTLQVLSQNFKIQQQAVELAFLQVESSLETFQAPPAPGGGGDNAASAAALTQQLLNAYARLPNEQTKLVTIWLNYQIARQQMFLDLELMPLDFRGVWIDEYNRVATELPRLGEPVPVP
jgi:hypothetical protein